MCVLLELATYYRFYYLKEGRTCTIECLLLLVTCLCIDVMIWRAHWSMTYDDPGFLHSVESIRKASEELNREQFAELVDKTVSRITGLKDASSSDWPELMIRRCSDCNMLKTS